MHAPTSDTALRSHLMYPTQRKDIQNNSD